MSYLLMGASLILLVGGGLLVNLSKALYCLAVLLAVAAYPLLSSEGLLTDPTTLFVGPLYIFSGVGAVLVGAHALLTKAGDLLAATFYIFSGVGIVLMGVHALLTKADEGFWGHLVMYVGAGLYGVGMILLVQSLKTYTSPFWGQRWWTQTLRQHGITTPFTTPTSLNQVSFTTHYNLIEDVTQWSTQAQHLMIDLGNSMRKPSTMGLNWISLIGTLLLATTGILDEIIDWFTASTGVIISSRFAMLLIGSVTIIGLVAFVNHQFNTMLSWIQQKTITLTHLPTPPDSTRVLPLHTTARRTRRGRKQ